MLLKPLPVAVVSVPCGWFFVLEARCSRRTYCHLGAVIPAPLLGVSGAVGL